MAGDAELGVVPFTRSYPHGAYGYTGICLGPVIRCIVNLSCVLRGFLPFSSLPFGKYISFWLFRNLLAPP